MEPLLSVITVNYNNCKGLQLTMESVNNQIGRNFEWLLIDGGSEDGSLELIKSNAELFSYWVSEKDKGIYDAQNKGIQHAKGKYLIFLNSGDSFYSNEVTRQFQRHCTNFSTLLYYGNSCLITEDGNSEILTPPPQLSNAYFYRNTLNHQACFILKEAFATLGLYQLHYQICADFDFLLRIYTSGPEKLQYLPMLVCRYDQSGISAMSSNYDRLEWERERILKHHFGNKEFYRLRNQHEASMSLKKRILLRLYRIPIAGKLIKKALRITLPHDKKA